MGVQSGSSVLHKVEGLSLQHVLNAAKELVEIGGCVDHPTIAVDASWIGLKGACSSDPVAYTIDVVTSFVAAGFHLIVVFDPDTRHHAKVASIKRAGARETLRAKAYHARIQTLEISSQLHAPGLAAEKRQELLDTQKKHQKMVKAAETLQLQCLNPGFRDQVIEELTRLPKDETGHAIQCVTGDFQADSPICNFVQKGTAQVILGNDSDFSFLLGERCLQIVEFSLSSVDGVKNISVKSGFWSMMMRVINNSDDLEESQIKYAEVPLIDEEPDPRFRVLVGLA